MKQSTIKKAESLQKRMLNYTIQISEYKPDKEEIPITLDENKKAESKNLNVIKQENEYFTDNEEQEVQNSLEKDFFNTNNKLKVKMSKPKKVPSSFKGLAKKKHKKPIAKLSDINIFKKRTNFINELKNGLEASNFIKTSKRKYVRMKYESSLSLKVNPTQLLFNSVINANPNEAERIFEDYSNLILDYKDSAGSTMLHIACRFGILSIVKLFIKYEADINVQDVFLY